MPSYHRWSSTTLCNITTHMSQLGHLFLCLAAHGAVSIPHKLLHHLAHMPASTTRYTPPRLQTPSKVQSTTANTTPASQLACIDVVAHCSIPLTGEANRSPSHNISRLLAGQDAIRQVTAPTRPPSWHAYQSRWIPVLRQIAKLAQPRQYCRD